MTGGCLCGAVRFTLHERPNQIEVCHCDLCRKFSGDVELGADVDPGKICGSGFFWRTRTKAWDGDPLFGLCVGAIDDLGDLELKTEMNIDRTPAGYACAGTTETKTKAEVEAMYAEPADGGYQ